MFFVGVLGGAAGLLGTMGRTSVPSGGGIVGQDMLVGGAAQAQGIAQEHVDMGKVSDAKNEAEVCMCVCVYIYIYIYIYIHTGPHAHIHT
jgi:hypothetical protein